MLQELLSSRFADIAPRLSVVKGQLIGVQDRPCERLHLIAEGRVLLSRKDSEGQEHALYLLGPGDMFGVGALLPASSWLVTARVVTDGCIFTLPGTHVATLTQYYPQLAKHIFALIAARLEQAHQRLDVIARKTARARLLALLCTLAEGYGEAHGKELWLSVPITQSELGTMIGLARETVARTLGELEAEGVIRSEGREGYWLRPDACDSVD